jgi:hypothetical protein
MEKLEGSFKMKYYIGFKRLERYFEMLPDNTEIRSLASALTSNPLC